MRRLVSIGQTLPYVGINHAGGEFVRRHLQALEALGFDITLVVPDETQNQLHRADVDPPQSRLILPVQPPHRDHFLRRLARRVRERLPLAPPIGFATACFRSEEVRTAIADATILELHRSEFASLVPKLRRINQTAPIIVLLHEVRTQRYERQWEKESVQHRRFARYLVYRLVRIVEHRQLELADVILVLCEKDRLLLVELGLGHLAKVVSPPLSRSHVSSYANASNGFLGEIGAPTVLFTAAFASRDNHEAAVWLLRDIWPAVVYRFPEAQCLLVGSGPNQQLRDLALNSVNVTVTGYVADFERYYRAASVAVVPLQSGAGVKFKTLEALLHGIPVVSTTIGAEGIGDESWFAAIADNSESFAASICNVLMSPVASVHSATFVRELADNEYSVERYLKTVERIYCVEPRSSANH